MSFDNEGTVVRLLSDDNYHRYSKQVARELRERRTFPDDSFDAFLPAPMGAISPHHWTPLAVSLRVAEWFSQLGVKTAVDLGSGVGKFCVATALAGEAELIGVEQRADLVEAATALAKLFGVADRVRFIHGVLGACEIPEADAYYLFNPFGENLFGSPLHVDEQVELSAERYDRDVKFVQGFMSRARLGTYVVEYNGIGGVMPQCYEPMLVETALPNPLRMWRKTSEP
jgi:hypothetical protein